MKNRNPEFAPPAGMMRVVSVSRKQAPRLMRRGVPNRRRVYSLERLTSMMAACAAKGRELGDILQDALRMLSMPAWKNG